MSQKILLRGKVTWGQIFESDVFIVYSQNSKTNNNIASSHSLTHGFICAQ